MPSRKASKTTQQPNSTLPLFPIRPIHDRVFVAAIKDREPASVIHLPESAKARVAPKEFVVLAVGDGLLLETGVRMPPLVKVGDIVILSDLRHSEHYLRGQQFLSVKEGDIVGVVKA